MSELQESLQKIENTLNQIEFSLAELHYTINNLNSPKLKITQSPYDLARGRYERQKEISERAKTFPA